MQTAAHAARGPAIRDHRPLDLGFTTIDGGLMREISSLYQEMIALAAHMDERYDGFKVRDPAQTVRLPRDADRTAEREQGERSWECVRGRDAVCAVFASVWRPRFMPMIVRSARGGGGLGGESVAACAADEPRV